MKTNWIYIISLLLIIFSCTEMNNENIIIHKNDLIIKSVDGFELTLFNPARDSIISMLKEYEIDKSDSLWFLIKKKDLSGLIQGSPPAPEGFESDQPPLYVRPTKYYYITGCNSINEKNLYLHDILKSKTNYDSLSASLCVNWDIGMEVNLAGDSILRVTQNWSGFLRN